MGKQIRIERLRVILPSRAAGGELGQIFVFAQAFYKFRGLFPDRHISRELGIPAMCETKLPEGRQHFPRCDAAWPEAEGFTKSVTHCRRGHGDAGIV